MAPVKRSPRNLIILSVIIVICIIVITVSFKDYGVFSKIRISTFDFFEPVQEKTYLFFRPVSQFFLNIKEYFNLAGENSDLKKENAEFIKDYSDNVNLRVENDSFRRLLGMQLRQDYETMTAKVIGYYENNWQSEVIINKGGSSGISEGMAVVNDQGLIGIVIFVSNNSSKVRLLDDPQSSIGTRLLSSRKLGMLEGSPEKKIYFNYITKGEEIFKGDILITSEFGGNIPAEILVGRVKSTSIQETSAYTIIEVEPFADYKKLEYVIIIKG